MKKNFSRSRIFNGVLDSLFRIGLFSAVPRVKPGQLTVLNYHRIDDVSSESFCTYKPNVSASPEMFALQMDYVKKAYNVISVGHLADWLQGKQTLPPRAAIITFDDGYFDNLAYAFPVLRDRGLPAVIFVTTDYMGGSRPFYWDYVAYCIYRTKKDRVRMPSGTYVSWNDSLSRDKVINAWVQSAKYLSTDERARVVDDLSGDLDVAVAENAFEGLYLTWDQIRELSELGIEFGAHTVTHPILTKTPLLQVEKELSGSRRRVLDETGKPVVSFAYPNGGASDFSSDVVGLVGKTGFDLAFTLMPGPCSYEEVRKNPFTIRRVYIGQSDRLPKFAAKLAGIERLAGLNSGKSHY
jgi:peptidoglycan/xylan/chitin deacetylase (PgdA/CDA1 family)